MGSDEPVWITGIGAATPLGCDLAEIESKPAGRPLGGHARSPGSRPTTIPAGSPRRSGRFPRPHGLRPVGIRGAATRWSRSRIWCAETALRDAGLLGPHRETRVGLVLGLGAEWMFLWETDHLGGRGPAVRPGAGPGIDDRADAPRPGALGPALGALGGVRQRQPRAGGRPALAAAGPGRRLRGGGLRPGGHADRAGDVRQPAGALAAERRPGRGVPAVRPRPRRLRAGRGGRGVRPGAIRRRPPAAGPAPMPRSPAAGPAATPTTT